VWENSLKVICNLSYWSNDSRILLGYPVQHWFQPTLATLAMAVCIETSRHLLNIWLDLLSLIGLHVHSSTHWQPPPPLLSPHLGSYTRAILVKVSQDRRHLFCVATPYGVVDFFIKASKLDFKRLTVQYEVKLANKTFWLCTRPNVQICLQSIF
jgi:hypothetical protein